MYFRLPIFTSCLLSVLCLTLNILASDDILLVGIVGGTASGKTTLAKLVQKEFREDEVTVFGQDNYYKDLSHLSVKEKESHNFDHPSAVDFDLLYEHLNQLKNNRSISCPRYDFKSSTRSKQQTVIKPNKVIIVEGILLFAIPKIRDLFDVKIYVDTDDDIRLMRRIQRDIAYRGCTLESVMRQYVATVKPMHRQFVEPTRNCADIIIPSHKHNQVGVSFVLSKLKELISRN